ncbi:MAG: Pyruvate dehydrogenase E1 component, alpha subunit [Candidatus Gottesmanbacteria bacterium GW2011_GWC2_39_8]|uniref:Pyruvate dehydrogenase E1 component, alpha subunit n=1 Tax=Candidatus Gottesmanbacteria bacterium GW2011_GWC2_39_8 TaxID=1618450 RepID=A0A0G0SWT3_9BACT|nr:MAG: Pyruvate dehydrogenase E1 component, alpha subunit [Candidatus Gottesmanbacteria bacterium GW2011_GWC2_39_8]
MELTKEDMVKLFTTMLTIRRFEEKVSELFLGGKIPGFIHLGIGQEAVAAGCCSPLKKEDYIANTHRGHGQCIAKGADIKILMAEIFGKATGYCKGKGGSMHLASLDLGILGANGIVAGGIPIAVGAAFSAKYRKSDQVVACFFGDGATGEGAFYESLNLASILKLPIIFVCENNHWAEFSPQSTHMDIEKVAQKALAFGNIKGETIDGNDVITVNNAMVKAIERARRGEGPTLLECNTTRYRGHYEGDPQKYRPKDDLESAKSNDAIERFKTFLLEKNIVTSKNIEDIEGEIKPKIDEAVKFAEESPLPLPEETLKDVYS